VRLYNTLTRREEDFSPADGKTVRMYTCGLTVYARGHIGNFRTFVALDVLRRALEFEGWTVRQVRNYTDVDDRTIVESVKSGRPLREYTQQFVEAFEGDAAALGLERVEYTPRATDHIPAMADMIKALEKNGHTYATDGSIYFKISTFPAYGRLARLDHSQPLPPSPAGRHRGPPPLRRPACGAAVPAGTQADPVLAPRHSSSRR